MEDSSSEEAEPRWPTRSFASLGEPLHSSAETRTDKTEAGSRQATKGEHQFQSIYEYRV